MSGAVQIIRSLATDISYLNKVKQSLGGDLGDENGADAVEGALTRGANAVQHLKEAWEDKPLSHLPKPTSISVQVGSIVVTWSLD